MFEVQPNGNVLVEHDLYVDLWPPGQSITIPAGFVCDGFSIPSLLWPIVGHPIGQPHLIPSVVHDWYCVQAKTAAERAYGDAVFLMLLERYADFSWLKRTLFYTAVRLYALTLWRPE